MNMNVERIPRNLSRGLALSMHICDLVIFMYYILSAKIFQTMG